ncbi:hypothetical protein KAW48_03215 [candidate division WOR-3 bacterium]|nr:hypothetical protein [candidate division WOR-3 bacterium]
MLTEPQKDGLKKNIRDFAESLSREQCRALYFRLDDIMQFGQGTVELFYTEVYNVLKSKEIREGDK